MEVYNASGNKIYDTTSRTGRIMASGTTSTIAHGANVEVSVTGMANSTDFNVICTPETGGDPESNAGAAGYSLIITKAANKFTIYNLSQVNNSYHYHVIKSGGS